MRPTEKPEIAFLWRPEEMTPAVINMARRTGTRAIFDLTAEKSFEAVQELLETTGATGVSDIMIPPSLLEETRFRNLLVSEGIENIWLETHPRFFQGGLPAFLETLERIPDRCRCFPVVGHVPWLMEMLEMDRKIPNIVLKGSEASGFVSSETILTLYATVRTMMHDRGVTASLFIWGGIGTPEAAGAFLSAGAGGIVFESLHWLTDLVRMDDGIRRRIERIRPEHTELVGVDRQTPCRLYNKGNSLVIKALDAFEDQGGLKTEGKENRGFVHKIQSSWIHPLDSRFSNRELIPLGVEAGFAASFVERYGRKTEQALGEFVSDVTAHLTAGKGVVNGHPTARKMGTPYPFIQGAMSWITDAPGFSRVISDAGGLPTVALGLLHGRELEERLGRLSKVMAGRPYGVNFIALPENPHREEQLAWIKELRPRFAVIAAGGPSHARDLESRGIEVIYVAPDVEMVKLAFESGIRYVICEGNEAGGHVGPHSTTTLAQSVFDLKRRQPALFQDRNVILAGGIFDRVTAFMAARLGADAIQMGTAYLATEEIVKTGALTHLYQRMVLESKPGGTVVSGGRQGLGTRALETPKTQKIRSLEHELQGKGRNEADIRRRLEDISVGSLFIAARGLEKAGGKSLDEKTCAMEGHFMSGACAGAIHQACSVMELHRELAEGFCENGAHGGEEFSENRLKVSGGARSGKVEDRVAVTGTSIFNALGNDPEAVWTAAMTMKSGVGFVPPSKWDHGLYYDPQLRNPDKTYCRVGAFGNLTVSRKGLGIAPHDFETMTGATKMTLWLAQKAIAESGILNSDIPRERIGVLISQNSGEAAGTLSDILIRGNAHQLLEAVKRAVSLTPEMEKAVVREIKAGRKPADDTTLLGRLNCAAAGFICHEYGFMGPTFSLSAACATSLAAVYTAVQMIRSGVIDAALVGGAEEPLMPMHFIEFSALGVLAGLKGSERPPAEASRPFDAERDGMVLGEGGGMVVLEREAVARKRSAGILGFITGIGASNSHLGLVESSGVTQETAIRASFKDAGYGPEDVDLVECHATGTLQGDVEEVRALKTFYKTDKPTAITSFKSQIGHTLGASGINSLIRGLLAMNAGILPPSINCSRPDAALGIEGSSLLIPTEPLEWKIGSRGSRRVQVNAFGFGGSNYVVQMEQCMNGAEAGTFRPGETVDRAPEKGAEDLVLKGISFFRTRVGDKGFRMAVLARNEDEARLKLNDFHRELRPPFSAKQANKLARKGIFPGAEKETPPPLAFLFPGQGSHYAGMGRALYDAFPLIREWMDRAASLADFELLKFLFQGTEDDLRKTWVQQPALFALECAIANQLMTLGVHPSAMAGHSVGEMAALWAAGVYSFEDGFRLVNMRARCMKKAASLHDDPGMMMAVHAAVDSVAELVSREGVSVANINAPNQVVLSGPTEAITAVGHELKNRGYRFTPLKVGMAFHSPIMRSVREAFATSISTIPLHSPRIPVISNITGKPFPSDEAVIRDMIVSQMESPVDWMADIKAIRNEYHVRWFVETGPKKILTNLLSDTLGDGRCIPTCLPSGEKKTFRSALARLFAIGHQALSKGPLFISFPGKRIRKAPQEKHPKSLEEIIQQGINAFVVEIYGRFLKPVLLESVQREWDPSFTPERLERVLTEMRFGNPSRCSLSTRDQQEKMTPENALSCAAVAPEDTSSLTPGNSRPEDVVEAVIGIIMAATGYERDEIDEHMDLRDDLAIRSSRLPVIMDAMERRFGITIDLTDFIHLRTIHEISRKVAEMVSMDSDTPPEKEAEHVPVRQDVKRILFSQARLGQGTPRSLSFNSDASVCVLSVGKKGRFQERMAKLFRREYGITTHFRDLLPRSTIILPPSKTGKGMQKAVRKLKTIPVLSGMVMDIRFLPFERYGSMDGVFTLLERIFSLVKVFMESPNRKFVLLVHDCREDGPERVLAEGVLGMLLGCAHEYPSVVFRSVGLDHNTDPETAVLNALNENDPVIERIHGDGGVFTVEGSPSPLVYRNSPEMGFCGKGVVVFSGGGGGITSRLARSLAPFEIRAVLLGRTKIDPGYDFSSLIAQDAPVDDAIRGMINEKHPDISKEAFWKEMIRFQKALEVVRALENLRARGMDASYHTCDVTRRGEVERVFERLIKQYGGIDGIVHGAGVIRDGWMRDMTDKDFSSVVHVKFSGTLNLFQAARNRGLKFFTCLSSVVSILGNPGQVNYAAANRVMSALVHVLKGKNPSIRFKSLILPPIEGIGMAEDPWIRKTMENRNIGYVHVDELAEFFLREHCFDASGHCRVMFTRSLPPVGTALLNPGGPSPGPGKHCVAGLIFHRRDFPMIDSVSHADLRGGALTAHRSFSHEKDSWLNDHRPIKSMKHPVVSGIIFIETLMEAARMLYPCLRPRKILDAWFLDMIQCPFGTVRPLTISCRRDSSEDGNVVCEVLPATKNASCGKPGENAVVSCKARVALGGEAKIPKEAAGRFHVRTDELDTPPVDGNGILTYYEQHSDLQGRYRIAMELYGTGPGVIGGRMTYREGRDFSHLDNAPYQYSPYLLEAFFHLPRLYAIIRKPAGGGNLLPVGIGEMVWTRKCMVGEKITLHARMKKDMRSGSLWDLMAFDEAGEPLMAVRGLRMQSVPA